MQIISEINLNYHQQRKVQTQTRKTVNVVKEPLKPKIFSLT